MFFHKNEVLILITILVGSQLYLSYMFYLFVKLHRIVTLNKNIRIEHIKYIIIKY